MLLRNGQDLATLLGLTSGSIQGIRIRIVQWKGNFKLIQKNEVLFKVLAGELIILEDQWDVFAVEDSPFYVRVSLIDYPGHHIIEPLGVDEVQFMKVVAPVIKVQ